MESTISVFSHKLGIDGKLLAGERHYGGDHVPDDLDRGLLRRLRAIGWVEDIPVAQWQPPSDDVLAARAARLEEQQRMATEEAERRQRLLDERHSDPQWLADQPRQSRRGSRAHGRQRAARGGRRSQPASARAHQAADSDRRVVASRGHGSSLLSLVNSSSARSRYSIASCCSPPRSARQRFA